MVCVPLADNEKPADKDNLTDNEPPADNKAQVIKLRTNPAALYATQAQAIEDLLLQTERMVEHAVAQLEVLDKSNEPATESDIEDGAEIEAKGREFVNAYHGR